jgi:hypothetical protein
MKEWKEKNVFPSRQMLKIALPGVIAMIKALLKHPLTLIKLNRAARKRSKTDHKLPYKIPTYRDGMPYCKSNEQYLRPAHFCESNAPEIIALANELGAFKKSDREYAEACFKFVKNNLKLSFDPMAGALGTLKRGSGHCVDQLSVFISLCRAGGLPARFRLYSLAIVESMYQSMVNVDPIVKEWYDALGFFMLHGTAEVKVDGEWLISDATFTPEYEAAMGVPLARLGDSPEGMWNMSIPERMMILEGIPYGIAAIWNFTVNVVGPGPAAGVNASLDADREKGRQMLKKITKEEYDRKVRSSYKATMPQITIEKEVFKNLPSLEEIEKFRKRKDEESI